MCNFIVCLDILLIFPIDVWEKLCFLIQSVPEISELIESDCLEFLKITCSLVCSAWHPFLRRVFGGWQNTVIAISMAVCG